MRAPETEQPVAVLVGMIETMLKRSEQYRREAEEDGDLNDGEKHARVSSVLKELARLGKGLGAAAPSCCCNESDLRLRSIAETETS